MNRGNRNTPICGMQIFRPCLRAASLAAGLAVAGTAGAEYWDTPQTRLRPIGSPSAVDAYNPPATGHDRSGNVAPTARSAGPLFPVPRTPDSSGSSVRQAVMMQATADGFSMPADSQAMPAPLTQSPAAGPIAPPPQESNNPSPLPRPNAAAPPAASAPVAGTAAPTAPPSGLAPVPRSAPPSTAASTAPALSGDYAPLAQPQLSTSFATMDNCRNITPPSGYRSDRILTCGPPVSYVTTVGASAPPPSYLPPPAQIGPPVSLPPGVVPADAFPLAPVQTVIPGSSGHRPLISFGQERYPVQVGQGIFGQPTAYVPGQSFRNAIRYLTW